MRNKWWWLGLGLILLVIIFSKQFTQLLEKPLMVYQEPVPVNVIVVHGGGTTKDKKLPLLAQQRLNHGLYLWRQGLAPQLLVTGGKINGSIEADLMAEDLVSRGVPVNSIIKEGESTNTYENVKNSSAILNKNKFTSAIIVTSPYHSYRVQKTWLKNWSAGQIYISSAPKTLSQTSINSFSALTNVIREYLAIAWYKINGRL